MEQRPDPALNNPVIGHDLEHLTIDGVAQRLGFRPRAAEAFGPLLEFDANPFDFDHTFLPVPGDAFHAHVRQIAAETAAMFDNFIVSTPACAELIAAARPPGPLPTTSTSVSATTGVTRAGSEISFMVAL